MTPLIAPPKRKNPQLRTPRLDLPPARRSRAAQFATEAACRGVFALQLCRDCGTFNYPPRDFCRQCLSENMAFRPVDNIGRLLTETTIRAPVHNFFRERAPWRIGIVELDADIRIVCHLHGDCVCGELVRMSAMLDRSGQATFFALPPQDTANMSDDSQLREFTATPKHRRVLVTDGRGSVGQAVARAVLAAGARQVFLGVSETWKPFTLPADLAEGGLTELVDLDVGDSRSIDRLASEIGGKVDILVNTAGYVRAGGVVDSASLDKFGLELEINTLGLARLARGFGPTMRSRGADGVSNAVAWVNLLSVYAHVNRPDFGAFSASQAAALSLSQAMRAEMRPGGVRVINLFSGPTETEWYQSVPAPKVAPAKLACEVVRALEKGLEDVYVGDIARDLRSRLDESAKAAERELGQ